MYYKDDVDRVMAAYPKVNFRFQISPTRNLPTMFIPIFSTLEETEYLQNEGFNDAKEAIIAMKSSSKAHLLSFNQ